MAKQIDLGMIDYKSDLATLRTMDVDILALEPNDWEIVNQLGKYSKLLSKVKSNKRRKMSDWEAIAEAEV